MRLSSAHFLAEDTVRIWRTVCVCILSGFLLMTSGLVSDAETTPLIGDVDGDGEITSQDAALLMRSMINAEQLDRDAYFRSDINADGVTNSADAASVLRILVDLEQPPSLLGSFSMVVTADLSGAVVSGTGERTATISHIASFVESERKHDRDLLLVDAGGSLYGSTVTDGYDAAVQYREGPMARAFSELKYDAVLLGTEAFSKSAQAVRDDVDYLREKGVQVLGTNLTKIAPSVTDEVLTTWNDVLPFAVFDIPAQGGGSIRVGMIGLSTDFSDGTQNDEMLAERYHYLVSHYLEQMEKELLCDCIIALMHTTIENDEGEETPEQMTARSLVEQTEGIDMVLCGYGNGRGIRSIQNLRKEEIPVIALADDANTVLKLNVGIRQDRQVICFNYEWADMLSFEEDAELKKLMNRYAAHADAVLDSRICTVTDTIAPYDNSVIQHTDLMEVIHRAHVDGVKLWAQENGIDLSPNIVSIAYPYIAAEGIESGTLYYRDICNVSMEKPNYSLLLVRGAELKAWLSEYAARIKTETEVYSLHGLQYLLNSLNPDAYLPFLQDAYGMEVQDDSVFTVIVAEKGEAGTLLKPYLDEEWMPYSERVLGEFAFPKPSFETIYHYEAADPLIAYLERMGTLTLEYSNNWYLW